MTDGDEEGTIPWIKRLKVKYAWGYEKTFFAFRSNIWAYPYAILVDPDGIVIWAGSPSDIPEDKIKENLKKSVEHPLWTWPQSLADVKKAVLAEDYKRAHDLYEQVKEKDESVAKYHEDLHTLMDQRVDLISRLYLNGDGYGAWNHAWRMEKAFAGMEKEHGKVVELKEMLAADAEVAADWKLQSEIVGLWKKPLTTKADAEGVIARCKAIVEKDDEAVAARRAALLAGYWSRMIALGHVK